MRAALSHSRSKDDGQKASEPSLLVILLMGPPSLPLSWYRRSPRLGLPPEVGFPWLPWPLAWLGGLWPGIVGGGGKCGAVNGALLPPPGPLYGGGWLESGGCGDPGPKLAVSA